MGFARNTRFLLSNYDTRSFDEAYFGRSNRLPRIISYDRKGGGVLQFAPMALIRQDIEGKHLSHVEVNSTIKLSCSAEQYFYLTDGTKVTASELKPGMQLLNVKTDTETFVTSVETVKSSEIMYACSVPRYGNYALASGIIVKA